MELQKQTKTTNKNLYKVLSNGNMNEIIKTLFPLSKDIKEKGIKESLRENIKYDLMASGLDLHYLPYASTSERHTPLAMNFSSQLINEYSCEKSYEKALVGIIASAFGRIVDFSPALHNAHNPQWFSAVSREIDRANKQFINALSMLNKIKDSSSKNK